MKIKDIMTTKPITASSNTSLKKITQIFNKTNIWSIFILDAQQLVGIITRNDLKFRGNGKSINTPASEIMSPTVYSIDADANVEEAIIQIDRLQINGLAVTKQGKLCGVVTRYDIRNRYYPHIKSDTNQHEMVYTRNNPYALNTNEQEIEYNTYTIPEIKEKIREWKKEGYKINELEQKLYQNQQKSIETKQSKKKKSKPKLITGIAIFVLITLMVTATIYVFFSGMTTSNEFSSSPSITPNLQIIKNNVKRELTIASADSSDLIWNEFEIMGDGDTSSLGSSVNPGDKIIDCSGTISIRHIPTNTLIGTWDFS